MCSRLGYRPEDRLTFAALVSDDEGMEVKSASILCGLPAFSVSSHRRGDGSVDLAEPSPLSKPFVGDAAEGTRATGPISVVFEREPSVAPGEGRSVEPQAAAGRLAFGERVANPTPLSVTNQTQRRTTR